MTGPKARPGSAPLPDRSAIAIFGPTASGKSALALALAEALDGTIVNADSMQIYRELRLLTARPSAADETRAPHRLYGALAGDDPCSAARWRDLALAEIDAARAAGRVPILVGGTGLYFKALIDGLSPVPPVPPAVREAVQAHHRRLGGPAFHADLAARDPAMAARLAPGDTQRLIRAAEVLMATGRSLAWWQAQPKDGPPDGLFLRQIVLTPPRAPLYARCDARFGAMLEAGALAEVRALLALDYPPHLPVMKAVGVPDLAAMLQGRLEPESAAARARQATRNYAKRQLTWARQQIPPQGPAHISHVLEAQYSESMLRDIFAFIRDSR